MEHLSVILFSFYSLAILAESTSTESSTMIETSLDNVHDVRDVKNHVDLKQNVQNNTKYPLIENPVKNSTQVGEHTKDPLYLNNASNAFTISTGDFTSSDIKDMQHNEDKENNADRIKEEPSEDLSSHDILLDPSLIPARLSRQTKKGDADYSNLASISSDVKSNNHDDSKSALPSKRNLTYEGDLSVAEDRYPSAYPYWNLYYRRRFPNLGYRANDGRDRYRNYWRYPVFSGK